MPRKKKKNVPARAVPKNTGGKATPLQPAAQRPSRIALVDALRGAAIVMMAAYHFAFDLNYFRFLHQNFYEDAFWITSRTIILGSFLTLVGISLTLSTNNGIRWSAYGRRLVQIAACAIIVSIGSYMLFPQSWIFFGVLHFIFIASVLGLAFIRLYWANLLAGTALIAVGSSIAFPVFDHPYLNWFGLMTHKPITEDYVPLLPWFGVVLIGMFVGKRVFGGARGAGTMQWKAGTFGRPLTWAGRHSLLLYMVHQPVLLGALYLALGSPH
jgi:uncharacterized membrane protein